MSTARKTVVIVEDDPRLREQLTGLIEAAEGLDCLGAVASAEEALIRIPSLRPDLVLMDNRLPGKSGIECIRDLKEKLPALEIIVLTAYDEGDNVFRALKEGASGYILKTSGGAEIIDAIRNVFAGSSPFSGPVARKIAMYFWEHPHPDSASENLSAREHEVLRLLAAGYIYKEVADQMGITLTTVRTYVKRICAKLHVRSKVEAIIKYLS